MKILKSLRAPFAVLCAISVLTSCVKTTPKLDVPQEREIVYTYQPCPDYKDSDYPDFVDGEYAFSPKNKEILTTLIRLLKEDLEAWKRIAKCYKAQEKTP